MLKIKLKESFIFILKKNERTFMSTQNIFEMKDGLRSWNNIVFVMFNKMNVENKNKKNLLFLFNKPHKILCQLKLC